MRAIAINLPQFHEMELNNKWWGKGFTEWTKVKNAMPLYEGHHQPQVPLGGAYYDMSLKETLLRQNELMKRGGVYGMAYYHYWYNNQPIMETPVENLLECKEINQKFMLYWCNCDWFYSEATKYQKKMILRQEYGAKKEWELHFQYLLRFFLDERYICVDHKPVLCIYRPGEIPNLDEMMDFFQEEAIKAGFAGLYIIETLFNYGETAYYEKTDAVMFREPNCGKKIAQAIVKEGTCKDSRFYSKEIKSNLLTHQYKELTEISVYNQLHTKKDRKSYFGVFPAWDNTPRHGYKGYIIDGSTPELFEKYISALHGGEEDEDDFLFINSWNEWAEGMQIEPSERFGYGYLDGLKKGLKKKISLDAFFEKKNYKEELIYNLQQYDKIFLYGAGLYGLETLRFLRKNLSDFMKKDIVFLDDTPQKIGTVLEGIPIVKPVQQLNTEASACFLLCCDERNHHILEQKLLKYGVKKEKIIIPEIAFMDFEEDRKYIQFHFEELKALYGLLSDRKSKKVLENVMKYRTEHDVRLLEEIADDLSKRYFDEELLSGRGRGSFADCGGYVGDTLLQYIAYRKEHPGKIWCFEPDEKNSMQIECMLSEKNLQDVELYKMGVWCRSGNVSYENIGDRSGCIKKEGSMSIPVETLDHVIGNEKLDFLKIEINGSEYEGLLGGASIIARDLPVIAVSVYHSLEDILRIPFLIKSLSPDYKIYLRYYGKKTLTDIVCYAISD